MPKVSVIVPNYNHATFLKQRLDSIFNQKYQDFEVILLDDCSTDNSREILELYRNHPKVSHIVYNKVNSGTSYKQWYRGIECASGELIWIAESDDWCNINFLMALVKHFEDTNISLAFTRSQFIYSGEKPDETQLSGVYQEWDGISFIREFMLSKNELFNASMVVFRKICYEKVKFCGYTQMFLCGDWLLWIQLMNNYKVVAIPDKLNYCRRHSTNTTTNYRTKGLDLIEGIKVLNIGVSICRGNFNRQIVYLKQIDNYRTYRTSFGPGINNTVLKTFLLNRPSLFIYLIYREFRSNIRRFYKAFNNI